jgi:hypothetical protein
VQRLFIAIVMLSFALASTARAVSAQATTEDLTAIDGNASTLGTGDASAAPGTVIRGKGTAVLGPDGTYNVTDVAPPSISVSGDTDVLSSAPEAAPAPVAEEPIYTEPVAEEPADTSAAEPVDTTVEDTAAEDTAVADTAVADETDLDGDNYPDAEELAVGLDPTSVDTDADGVADGDEVNIYGTDPLVWDSDGDGVSDGDELYNSRTDPLVWNDFSTDGTSGAGTESLDAGAAQQ